MKYHKQVRKGAKQLLQHVSNGMSLIVCLAAMQSGKTELIACAFEMLRRMYPGCMGLYVTAHNHLDFVSQNFLRLEHLVAQDLYCLGLRERRASQIGNRPLSSFSNSPVFIFFDENHFGDGVVQTIFQWLTVNKLYPGRKVILIGVSATPFSSIKRAGNAVVRFLFSDMPNYKSVTYMLDHGHIKESEQLVINGDDGLIIDTKNAAFLELEKHILFKKGGYAIFRMNKKGSSELLETELKSRFGDKVHVRHWNQANQLRCSPQEYFSLERAGIFTVVIVKQKARMGNTIPTQHLRMVYEHSPKASVATVAQGLLGRCCGHNKLKHKVTVYSHKKQAKAYSYFERGLFDDFISHMEEHKLKASDRSAIASTEMESCEGKVAGNAGAKRKEIINSVLNDLSGRYGVVGSQTAVVVRRWSTNKNAEERNRYNQIIAAGENPTLTKPNKAPGSLSIYVDNRKNRHDIYYAYRTDTVLIKGDLVPSEKTFYSTI